MSEKITTCKTCGAEIASNAAVCPKCGAKNKKPFYKRWWFWCLIVILIIFTGAASSGNSNDPAPSQPAANSSVSDASGASSSAAAEKPAEEEPISYEVHDVTELFDALDKNALNAQQTYKGKYVEITGYLGTIDSSGKYIGVNAGENNYDYLFQEVQCYIKSEEQLQQISSMSKGDPITICGKITEVGEVLGYSLNIDSIK